MPRHQPSEAAGKLNPRWIRDARQHFHHFLRETGFPEPERNGSRGSTFAYPERMVMFIAVLAVKAKVKSYQGIHRLVVEHWPQIVPGSGRTPISESQLRERLKKIRWEPGTTPAFVLQVFPRAAFEEDPSSHHRERGQDDDTDERTRVAPEAETAGDRPSRTSRTRS